MVHFRCEVCRQFEYDSERGNPKAAISPGTLPEALPEGWKCPVCSADKSHLLPFPGERVIAPISPVFRCPVCGATGVVEPATPPRASGRSTAEEIVPWERGPEEYLEDIREMAISGRSRLEPMRTRKRVISWDEILIKGAQIARIPLDAGHAVTTRTVIGPRARIPMVLEAPVIVSHMSYGALSREGQIAIARGSAAVKTAMGSGEGGILEDARREAYRYILEYVPNRYGITASNLRTADAVEIKIGQSAEPGLGARLRADKVTPEIARVRGYPPGVDIVSPATFPDIRSKEDLLEKVRWLREMSGGRPIGVKIAAGDIEADLTAVLFAEPDFITIDGRPGGTGAAPKFVKAATSVPTIFALCRAREFLDREGADGVSLVITGGLRVSSDFAKALAMGADAVAIGSAALMACACRQHRICDTGRCPEGVTTQDPLLRERFDIEKSAVRLENYLRVSIEELKDFARLTGNDDVHGLSIRDICTTSSEISGHTRIPHV
ncbi:glutamate synthase domain-containing protein 2/rubredoxin [Methanolinea mesophila]|uniref:glutamate synthase-related protein n=1 Tax=Methanolinea mesophila TaxID=547055 RepID=UPI001AE67F06|nr:glutamate synthase-related protein [Methanolinea mesophila]MBP1928260.1 glutamate synthase domain-containing protein 2/rubredoxin [Methanolinea mesophila]